MVPICLLKSVRTDSSVSCAFELAAPADSAAVSFARLSISFEEFIIAPYTVG